LDRSQAGGPNTCFLIGSSLAATLHAFTESEFRWMCLLSRFTFLVLYVPPAVCAPAPAAHTPELARVARSPSPQKQ